MRALTTSSHRHPATPSRHELLWRDRIMHFNRNIMCLSRHSLAAEAVVMTNLPSALPTSDVMRGSEKSDLQDQEPDKKRPYVPATGPAMSPAFAHSAGNSPSCDHAKARVCTRRGERLSIKTAFLRLDLPRLQFSPRLPWAAYARSQDSPQGPLCACCVQ